MVVQDKAIKRYKVQNIVAPEGISYFTKASVLDGAALVPPLISSSFLFLTVGAAVADQTAALQGCDMEISVPHLFSDPLVS